MTRTILYNRTLSVQWLIVAAMLAMSLLIVQPTAAKPAATTSGKLVYALTASNRLLSFNSYQPGYILSSIALTGLAANDSLVGIDFRPATDRLYGLGRSGQVYVIDTGTGFARPIGTPLALSGSNFGIDFNPAADRLRIVSDSGQNLRVNPDTGIAIVDSMLAYGAGDMNAGKTPGVVAAAYTNPDNDPATATALYDIDAALGVFALQSPPNDGTLKSVVSANAPLTGLLGFDIGSDNTGLAAFQPIGSAASRLAYVDVTMGMAEELGEIGGGETITGLAIVLNSARYEEVYALNSAQELLGFKANNPGRIRTRVMISGMQSGEYLLGIDFRPASGRLYGVGSTSQIYVINHMSGVAAAVGAPISPAVPLGDVGYGIDFNPAADRLRVTNSVGLNLRINVDSGMVTVDKPLVFDPSDPNSSRSPRVVGSAYLNNDNDPATATTLYNLDADSDILTVQNPPNDGVQKTLGMLAVDVPVLSGFDIGSNNQALAAFQKAGASHTRLYGVDLTNGKSKEYGRIGKNGEVITGLAISLDQDR
jgi:Domain of unknown function (DUF4394)